MRLSLGILSGALLVLLGPTLLATMQQGQAGIDGIWAGQTSQGKTISFNIQGAGMTWLSLDWSLPLKEICATTPGSPIGITSTGGQEKFFFYPDSPGSEPPKMTYPTFTLKKAVGGTPEKVQMVLTGKFSSTSEVAGTIDLTATGCKGTEKLTWQAKKKPQ